jgi:hypothetical protein
VSGHFLVDTMRWSVLSSLSFWPGGKNYAFNDRHIKTWLDQAGLEVDNIVPLFPIGPYLLARLPLPMARLSLKAGQHRPDRCKAVALWNVYRSA